MILMLILATPGFSQTVKREGIILDTLTSAELIALPASKKQKGSIFFDRDLDCHVTWDGSAFNCLGGGSGDVTASLDITDNRIVRGDGGGKGVQESGWEIDDSNNMIAAGELRAGTIRPISPGVGTVGTLVNFYLRMYAKNFYLDGYAPADDDWNILSNSSGHLDFEIGSGGTTSSLYTLNGTGTPANNSDLISKLFADNNYLPFSGGTMTGVLNMGGFNLNNLDVLSIGSGLDGDILIPGNGSLTIGANGGVIPAMTVDGSSGTIDFPGPVPTIDPDAYDPISWANNTEVADKGSIQAEMEKKLNSDLTGEPAGAGKIPNFVQISVADYKAAEDAGTLQAGTFYYQNDASPMYVISTSDWNTDNGAVTMDGWKAADDRTIDEGTFTFSDCDPGEKFTVWINRGSAPTLAGTGLTFNQLPNTTAFAAATEMGMYFEVGLDGTTIDWYYYER